MIVVAARGLRKVYGSTVALGGVDLEVEEGRIVGLVGRNGAGKSTALQAILGLVPHEGSLRVLGRDPWRERERLLTEVSYIADVALLPRWLRVAQAIDFVAGVHPRFRRDQAEAFLAKTSIARTSRVGELSKGMVTQLHLALVMAIDSRLLLLDEPTLGLDVVYRKQFYDALLHDYYDKRRTIVVTTHQVEEVEDLLTDLVFLDRGRVVLDGSMEEIAARFAEVAVAPDRLAAARELAPIHERRGLGRSHLLYDGVERARLAALGELKTPGIADLFVALLGPEAGGAPR